MGRRRKKESPKVKGSREGTPQAGRRQDKGGKGRQEPPPPLPRLEGGNTRGEKGQEGAPQAVSRGGEKSRHPPGWRDTR